MPTSGPVCGLSRKPLNVRLPRSRSGVPRSSKSTAPPSLLKTMVFMIGGWQGRAALRQSLGVHQELRSRARVLWPRNRQPAADTPVSGLGTLPSPPHVLGSGSDAFTGATGVVSALFTQTDARGPGTGIPKPSHVSRLSGPAYEHPADAVSMFPGGERGSDRAGRAAGAAVNPSGRQQPPAKTGAPGSLILPAGHRSLMLLPSSAQQNQLFLSFCAQRSNPRSCREPGARINRTEVAVQILRFSCS